MTNHTLKVVIPMAGLGTRLRPQTWSKPKQLVSVAGKPVLSHLLDGLSSYPGYEEIELINIVGYLGDQIEEFVRSHYPNLKSRFILQENPCGQSHAIILAREYLQGPMLVVFADTLIETDLSSLVNEEAEAIGWVKPVPDPRRFGVAELNPEGWVTRLIEKPQTKDNNLAVVGFYYFQEAQDLLSAIDEQMEKNIQLKGEFFLVDAINIMLRRGLRMRTQKVDVWLDAGTPETVLDTNRYLLAHGHDNSLETQKRGGFFVIPPVFVHPNAIVQNAVIGPNVSIGAGCQIQNCVIQNSIFEDQTQADEVVLTNSIIGCNAHLQGRALNINAGDDTKITL